MLLVEGECARVDVEKGSECVCSSFGSPPSLTQECMRFRMYDTNSDSIHYQCMRTDA